MENACEAAFVFNKLPEFANSNCKENCDQDIAKCELSFGGPLMYIWLMMTLYFATIVFYTLEKLLTFFAWKTYKEHHPDDHKDLKHRKQSFADQHKEHSIAIAARTLGLLFINALSVSFEIQNRIDF